MLFMKFFKSFFGIINLFASTENLYFIKHWRKRRILRFGDLISEKKKNELITKSNLRQLDFTPLDQFRLISSLNAPPNQWRDLLSRPFHPVEKAFNLQVLHFKCTVNINNLN